MDDANPGHDDGHLQCQKIQQPSPYGCASLETGPRDETRGTTTRQASEEHIQMRIVTDDILLPGAYTVPDTNIKASSKHICQAK